MGIYQICAIGVLVCTGITLAGILMLTIFTQNEYFEISIGSKISAPIHFLSTIIGTLLAGKLTPERKAMSCLVTGVGYLLIIISCAILFYDGIGSGIWSGTAGSLLGTVMGIFLCTREKKQTAGKKRRTVSR